MADNSKISWCNATWPVVMGCDYESPGRTNCYAPKEVWRQAHNPVIKASLPIMVEKRNGRLIWNGNIALRRDRLNWPLKWAKPRMIFVPSLGDLFHEDVPFDFIDQVFAVMALCPRHTFQVLTKRVDRMAEYLMCPERAEHLAWLAHELYGEMNDAGTSHRANYTAFANYLESGELMSKVWPIKWIIPGASVENHEWAEKRLRHLKLLTNAGWTTFISYEPALGPVKWRQFEGCFSGAVSGGESGKNARPSHPDWHRALRDFCVTRKLAYHFKQWGRIRAGHPAV
jgi:protein gp37